MRFVEDAEEFAVGLRAAQLRFELDQRRGRPTPDWILAIIAEGERRDREATATTR
jgi:hypothetical protein